MTEHPVDDYLATLDPARRERVAAVYAVARDVAPHAVQATSYAMPCLAVDTPRGRKGLVAVMSTARHVGIYPYSGSAIDPHRDALAAVGIATTKGAVQLPDAVDLPVDVLRALIVTRLAELA